MDNLSQAKLEKSLEMELQPKESRFRIPHIYVILVCFILTVAVASYIVPAGQYERVEGPGGRKVVVPDSYQVIEQSPITVVTLLSSIPKGLIDAAPVVFFTFIVGGAFAVLKRTGIIELGVGKLASSFSKRTILIIPVLMTVFAIIASFIGTPELAMVYVPVILPLLLRLGYDTITATAIALCSTAAGFTAALTNPFTVGTAQMIAELPLFSGIEYRAMVLVAILIVGSAYLMRYATRVKNRPELSLMYEEDKIKRLELLSKGQTKIEKASTRQVLAGIAAGLFFFLLVYGVLQLKWGMVELAGIFIAMGVICGFLAGMKTEEICNGFNEGFRDVLMGAIIIGVARAISVVMVEGKIMDTIVFHLAALVSDFPSSITVLGMLLVQTLFNFFVPSGSGQAVITMPIMAPLADLVGVTRQTSILAFQLGDGLSNVFFPTSGYFMATLAIAGVPYTKWLKFMVPLLAAWLAVGAVFLLIAQAIQWGPF